MALMPGSNIPLEGMSRLALLMRKRQQALQATGTGQPTTGSSMNVNALGPQLSNPLQAQVPEPTVPGMDQNPEIPRKKPRKRNVGTSPPMEIIQ